MWVKPAEGMKVRRPPFSGRVGTLLPDEGAEVPDHDHYWHRRVQFGDVVVVPPEKAPRGSLDGMVKEPASSPAEHEDNQP
jgi:hypothetical protein